MEIGAVANVVGVLPEVVRTAKSLYDLRGRYKDASLLINAIYTESLVVHASLCQVENYVQRGALKDKPELNTTFDTALTGCRVVYSCLDEEVRELAEKANNEELKRKDRIKFLWKEETMKEYLQQIRGQQLALTLLLQGLQMESLSDIKRLVEDNSVTLQRVATRSKSLRATHPKVKVPDSVFDVDSNAKTLSDDAESTLSQAEFAFDDDVVNSKAYRRAMALATARANGTVEDFEPIEGDLIDLETQPENEDVTNENQVQSETLDDLKSLDLTPKASENSQDAADEEEADGQDDWLNELERNMLPFMPPLSAANTGTISSPPLPSGSHESTKSSAVNTTSFATAPEVEAEEEKPPALPPRRTTSDMRKLVDRHHSGSSNKPERKSSGTDDADSGISIPTTYSAPSRSSSLTVSESTVYEPSIASKIERKPLPMAPTNSVSTKPAGLFDSLTSEPEELRLVSSEDMQSHRVWQELVKGEEEFISRLEAFHQSFFLPIINKWYMLAPHVQAIDNFRQIALLHKQHVLEPMQMQLRGKSMGVCNPAIFDEWAQKVHALYRSYSQLLPHTERAIHLTLRMDPKFRSFLDGTGLSLVWSGKTWEDYLRLPITQLDLYCAKLGQLADIASKLGTPCAKGEEMQLKQALQVIQSGKVSCQRHIDESVRREELQSLYRRIHSVDAGYVNSLDMTAPGRTIVHQGRLAVRVNDSGSWIPVHAVLLNNAFFWGRVKAPKFARIEKAKKEEPKKKGQVEGKPLWVLEEPVPVAELAIALPSAGNQIVKASILDDIPRGSILYQLFVRNTKWSLGHTFGAYELAELQQWTVQLNAVRDAFVSLNTT